MAALGRTRLHRHAPGEAHQLGQRYAAHLDNVATLNHQPPLPACGVGQPQYGGNVGPVIAAATATTSAPASEPQAHAAGAVSSCASDANGSVVHALMERHYVQDTLESTSGARRLLHFVLFLSPCLAQNAAADKLGGDRRVQDFAAAFGLAFALIGRADPDLIQIVLLSVQVSLGAVAWPA